MRCTETKEVRAVAKKVKHPPGVCSDVWHRQAEGQLGSCVSLVLRVELIPEVRLVVRREISEKSGWLYISAYLEVIRQGIQNLSDRRIGD